VFEVTGSEKLKRPERVVLAAADAARADVPALGVSSSPAVKIDASGSSETASRPGSFAMVSQSVRRARVALVAVAALEGARREAAGGEATHALATSARAKEAQAATSTRTPSSTIRMVRGDAAGNAVLRDMLASGPVEDMWPWSGHMDQRPSRPTATGGALGFF
jgi:hypothetical protein